MAVPAHDSRDLEFAEKFNLPVLKVVQAPDGQDSIGFVGEGVSVNSGFLNDLPTSEAKPKMIEWLSENKVGSRRINFKLRDWLFSRQRFWGNLSRYFGKTDNIEQLVSMNCRSCHLI